MRRFVLPLLFATFLASCTPLAEPPSSHEASASDIVVDLKLPEGELKTGIPLTFTVTVRKSDGTIPDIQIAHEHALHAIIVGSDLQTFAHLHPGMSDVGDFSRCLSTGHAHREGTLTTQKNGAGTVTGWTCTLSSHHVCTAGPDGKWKECTFPPQEMAWPEPVSAEVLANPSLVGDPDEYEEPASKDEQTMAKEGTFELQHTFARAGRYLVAVDFSIDGKTVSREFTVDVAGKPALEKPSFDQAEEQMVSDYHVRFDRPDTIRANEEVTLSYTVELEGSPVTDLEAYLGAPMHVAIVRDDLGTFEHTHGTLPQGGATHDHEEIPSRFGPTLDVKTVFPGAGTYVLFGEFQHHGRSHRARFAVEVE